MHSANQSQFAAGNWTTDGGWRTLSRTLHCRAANSRAQDRPWPHPPSPPPLDGFRTATLPCLALPCLCFFWPPLCSREPPSNVRLSHAGTGIPPQLRARFSSPPGPAAGSRRARTRPCFPQRPRRRLLLRDLPAARLPLASQAKAGRHICLTFRSFWTAFCSARHSFRAAPRLVRLILPTWATGAAVALFLASPFPLTAARAEPLFSPAWDAEKESARGILVGPLSPHA